MNDEEYLSFDAEMADVKRLASADILPPTPALTGLDRSKQARREAAQASQHKLPDTLSTEIREMLAPEAQLSFMRPGVQHGVFKKLRLGQYQIEARLDLHKHSVEQARLAVSGFIKDCLRIEARCAIIVHGIGRYSNPPALLKSAVNQWLQAIPEVQAFHSCQPHHGGLGAAYLMLKKGANKKLENRERLHQRRS